MTQTENTDTSPPLFDIIKGGAEMIREKMEPDEDWTANLFLQFSDGEVGIISLHELICQMPEKVVGKMGLAMSYVAKLGPYIEQIDQHGTPEMMGIVNTSWALKMTQKFDPEVMDHSDVPEPREHPERMEVVIVQVTDNENVWYSMATIKRNEKDPPALEDWADTTGKMDDYLGAVRDGFEALFNVAP